MAKDEFGTNSESAVNKEHDKYIDTLVVDGKMINVFMNDYGQCYWFQWLNDKGELESNTCGTYNFDYKGEIEEFFKPEVESLSESVLKLKKDMHELRSLILNIEKDLKEKENNENG